ncbi:calcium-binding protein, partial [Roseibium sp. RKSG952]|uniref:calcium-binding protein n=1 Tax=Roseibium sp. RKSG952 TaxID=2529384 RepID=UPI0034CD6863
VGPDGTVHEATGLVNITQFETSDMELTGSDVGETLTGGIGDDVIEGNGGDDLIQAGTGDDIIAGGAGDDTYVLDLALDGHDIITDFAAGSESEDVLQIDTSVVTDFDALILLAADDGSDTVIMIDIDTSVTLQGVAVSDLHEDDFAFI